MSYTVTVPATSANLGPGFDAIGLALQLYNQFTFTETKQSLQIDVVGEGSERIYRDERNLVYQAAQRLFELVGFRPKGLHIQINNNVPAASGMGSSSTAIIGGLLGANALAGHPLDQAEILRQACLIEGHPDNVMPALLGGLTIGVLDGDKVVSEKIEMSALKVVIVLPDFPTLTKESRAVLPAQISMQDAIFNISRSTLLLRALTTSDFAKLRVAMQDRLHQPYRLPLIPGFEPAMAAAYAAGAAGVAQSGAGPSLIAITPSNHQRIADAVMTIFAEHGLASRYWIVAVDNDGAVTRTE